MRTRKLIAIVLSIAMVAGMFSFSAAAATNTSTTQLDVSGNDRIGSVEVTTTQPVVSVTKTKTTSGVQANGLANSVYQYDIALPGTVANGDQVTITMNPTSPAFGAPMPPIPQFFGPLGNIYSHNTSYTASATVKNGTASIVAYLHKDFANCRNSCDTYKFNFCIYYPISIGTADGAYIDWNGANGTVKGNDDPSVLPAEFTLWAETDEITVDGVTTEPDYSNSGNYAYTIIPDTEDDTVIVATISGTTYTILCPARAAVSLPAGVAPTSVVSYLPLGQFATGGGWGSSVNKFAGKTTLDSTGVSLGSLGGYIEFFFEDGIMDDPKNPYGVDFVVYGNAFNGNPEAGAVQVSEDGHTWYELAGSQYYNGGFNWVGNQGAAGKYINAYTGTLRNTNVIYTKLSDQIKADFAGHNEKFTSGNAWWPLAAEGYPMGTPHTGGEVTVSHSDDTLAFGGITAIPDSNVTADYGFGYADVTPNGSPSNLGDAVNPYTAYTSSKTGGDGFDLEWAVDITTGLPVSVADRTFHYVRVYSNVLDNGTFGETSCEVCGIFTAYREAGENVNVGRTTAPTIRYNGTNINSLNATVSYAGDTVIYDIPGNLAAGKKVKVTGAGSSIVNINGANSTEFTVTETGQYVRIIVQNGTKEPYIVIIK